MKKRYLIAFYYVVLVLGCSIQEEDDNAKAIMPYSLENSVIEFLSKDASYNDELNILTVKRKNNALKLITMLKYYQLQINLNMENINNIETTRTLERIPYQKQIAEIDANGQIQIIHPSNNIFRLVYDPTHPDAIKVGDKAGYVEYPSIDKYTEIQELKKNISLFNSFVDLIQFLNSKIVIEKISYMEMLLEMQTIELEDCNKFGKLRISLEMQEK